jgi:hypothetical protein
MRDAQIVCSQAFPASSEASGEWMTCAAAELHLAIVCDARYVGTKVTARLLPTDLQALAPVAYLVYRVTRSYVRARATRDHARTGCDLPTKYRRPQPKG